MKPLLHDRIPDAHPLPARVAHADAIKAAEHRGFVRGLEAARLMTKQGATPSWLRLALDTRIAKERKKVTP